VTRPAIPYVTGGLLHRADGTPICAVGPRSGWLDWLSLAQHRSFRFEAAAGPTCTLVKEKRKGASGRIFFYWLAHRRIDGRLRRVYLGKPERLTLANLEKAAIRLGQLEMGLD
jgi:hypothetical protein